MEKHFAYCSACDRQVEVIVKPGGRRNPDTGEAEDEIVCLEFGETCTGAMCPMCDLPTDAMRESFEKHRDGAADPE
ncbi:MAG: hypothetical protein RRA92_03490 [Gemmatimonadota bacterium]|nr:hypothetical protein [Gemmatimonadota bacterium]